MAARSTSAATTTHSRDERRRPQSLQTHRSRRSTLIQMIDAPARPDRREATVDHGSSRSLAGNRRLIWQEGMRTDVGVGTNTGRDRRGRRIKED